MNNGEDMVKCLGMWCSLKRYCMRYDWKAERAIPCCDQEDRNGFISKSGEAPSIT